MSRSHGRAPKWKKLALPSLGSRTAAIHLVLEAEPAMLVTRWNMRLEDGRATRWKAPGAQGPGATGSAFSCGCPRCYFVLLCG